jgi:copper oxidase (laccase) domain-containing protein
MIVLTTDNSVTRQSPLGGLFSGGFLVFLETVGQSLVPQQVMSSRGDTLRTTAHGSNGARVVWSINEALENSWRVAAHHSSDIADIEHFDVEHIPSADGIFTTGSKFCSPLAIRTADCLAVAVTLESGSQIIAASCFHAGWRGYCGGIQTLAASKFGQAQLRATQPSEQHNPSLWVSIGPAIQGRSYPCGDDVLEALRIHHNSRLLPLAGWTEVHERAFWLSAGLHPKSTQTKIYPDLQELLCIELHAQGFDLSTVAVYRDDTMTSSHWPSHRRAITSGSPSTDRLVTHLCPPACP